jgi:hypothetical protein
MVFESALPAWRCPPAPAPERQDICFCSPGGYLLLRSVARWRHALPVPPLRPQRLQALSCGRSLTGASSYAGSERLALTRGTRGCWVPTESSCYVATSMPALPYVLPPTHPARTPVVRGREIGNAAPALLRCLTSHRASGQRSRPRPDLGVSARQPAWRSPPPWHSAGAACRPATPSTSCFDSPGGRRAVLLEGQAV